MKEPKYNAVDFQDLTEFDRNLIRSIAHNIYLEKRDIQPSDALIEAVFQSLASQGMQIVKDETKIPTWSSPKASWYDQTYKTHKGWW